MRYEGCFIIYDLLFIYKKNLEIQKDKKSKKINNNIDCKRFQEIGLL